MEIRHYNGLNVLIADEGKHIRSVDDIYKPATEEEPEYFPYYTSIIYLAKGFDETKLNESFVEEPIDTK